MSSLFLRKSKDMFLKLSRVSPWITMERHRQPLKPRLKLLITLRLLMQLQGLNVWLSCGKQHHNTVCAWGMYFVLFRIIFPTTVKILKSQFWETAMSLCDVEDLIIRFFPTRKKKLQASGNGKTYSVRTNTCQRIKGQASWNFLGHHGAFVFDHIFFIKKTFLVYTCFDVN